MNTKRILGMALLALGAAAVRAAEANDLWLHIKVNNEAEGSKVSVDLPLSVVRAAMPLLPREARAAGAIRIDHRDVDLAELRRIWREVEKSPDGTYVSVRDGRDQVQVAKRGGYLLLHVVDSGRDGGSEKVEVKLPLPVVRALLAAGGDRFDLAAALNALAETGEGELVTVNGDHETVRLWVGGPPAGSEDR